MNREEKNQQTRRRIMDNALAEFSYYFAAKIQLCRISPRFNRRMLRILL